MSSHTTANCRYLFAIEHANNTKDKQFQKRREHTGDNPELGSSFAKSVKFNDGSSEGSKRRVERLNMTRGVINPSITRGPPAIDQCGLVGDNINPPDGDANFVCRDVVVLNRACARSLSALKSELMPNSSVSKIQKSGVHYLLDSGASCHMTPDVEALFNFKSIR